MQYYTLEQSDLTYYCARCVLLEEAPKNFTIYEENDNFWTEIGRISAFTVNGRR